MTFTKKELITLLNKIHNAHNININNYINEIIENDIPINALKFINLLVIPILLIRIWIHTPWGKY